MRVSIPCNCSKITTGVSLTHLLLPAFLQWLSRQAKHSYTINHKPHIQISMEAIFSFEALTALMTLVFLEIILGIDNVIFISIVANKLPESGRAKAWRVGLLLALIIRAGMLFTIS